MLKNAIIFQVTPGFRLDPEMLQRRPAVPCAPNQARTVGFAEPCAHSTANLVHHVAGHSVICLETEDRLLPGSVVQEEVDQRAEVMEKNRGYKPGRKQLKALKELVTDELLPKAFTQKRRTMGVLTGQYLIIDTSSPARAELMIETLRRALDNLPLTLIKTQKHITHQMIEWLIGECPSSLTVDDYIELERPESGKPAISYKRTQLAADDMHRCIAAGYLPRKMGITFNDRLSLKVDDSLHLKQLAPLDLMNTDKRKQDSEADSMAEAFDADIALMVGEVVQTMDTLIEELGGLVEPDEDLITPGAANPARPEDSEDPLYLDAVAVVLKQGRASISLIQHHLRIGYNRAARLIEVMEINKIVSAMDGSGARKLLVDRQSMTTVASAMQNLHDTANKYGGTITIEQNGEVLATFGAQA